ncbi:MAG: response regulator [Candidatus Sungbacteria bacterium]|uniref:Response regulator n=1 Tax=Candidatus Sungiibacteriota bacterium TaxID=2750080 RepID=A0A931YD59_9BACT|nr:response regulator [Candidatus Sungbacteria bacterium]MBI2465682.1 response regulator [Candidatus Sungbacteria bacterium]
MKILIVDDSVRHRRAGKKQLEALGHEVVAVSEYGEARKLAKEGGFDIALLDLLMPAEATTLGPDARTEHVGREIAIGFPLLLSLAGLVGKIAVATDTNHHNHPMSAAVDWFLGDRKLVVNGTTVLVMHAPMTEDGTKNWGKVLERLLINEP